MFELVDLLKLKNLQPEIENIKVQAIYCDTNTIKIILEHWTQNPIDKNTFSWDKLGGHSIR